MNFAAVLEALNQASGFELYRLRAALDRILDDPKWIIPIAQQLHQGQRIDYFDCQGNTTRSAQVLELRNKRVLVRDEQDGRSWLIPYAAINLAGVDVRIREATPTGLGRHEIASPITCVATTQRSSPSIISANRRSASPWQRSMRQASSGVAAQSRAMKSASRPGWKLPMQSSR
jgi:hypothetical protein